MSERTSFSKLSKMARSLTAYPTLAAVEQMTASGSDESAIRIIGLYRGLPIATTDQQRAVIVALQTAFNKIRDDRP